MPWCLAILWDVLDVWDSDLGASYRYLGGIWAARVLTSNGSGLADMDYTTTPVRHIRGLQVARPNYVCKHVHVNN